MSAYGHTTEPKDFDDRGNLKSTAAGSGNIVTFWLEDRIGENNSIVQREMVDIRAPGDKSSVWSGKVDDKIRKEYPREYDAFKRGAELSASGTPVQTWTDISLNTRREIMFLGFTTIEQLAAASDGQCGGITNGNVIRRKAQLHVDKNRVIVDKDAQIADLNARLARLEASNVLPQSGTGDGKPKNKGGRPRSTGDKTRSEGVTGGVAGVSAGPSSQD